MSLALIRSSPTVDLNPEQRLAVEHGIGDPHVPRPLLVIAGAGSGKTAMLAHRVAALILSGADPKRIMLATFSRRAAAELGRRVERLLARRLAPEAAAAATPAYAGTFHAIGARLLREYATRLGLDPQFTIHDREDSADLMNWARHEMGVGDVKLRFPTKATCLTMQGGIVLALRPEGRGLTVVGDDAQAIYSFRAATVRNILEFPGAFDPPAHVVTLERNYRSSGAILAAANAVIALAPERFAKTLRTDRPHGPLPLLVAVADDSDQARFVATSVLANREAGASLKVQAVLFRVSHHSAALELELTRRNVPFAKYGGLKFLDAAHVKDAVALMRFAENPRDRVAGFRVAQLLPGVGPKVAEAIVAAAAADDGFATMAALSPPARVRPGFPAFVDLMRRFASCVVPWPAELADAVAWLKPLIETRYGDARVRMGDLDALEGIAASFPSRERFLSELALDPPDATSDEAGPPLRDEDFLILSTIHSAKGQEWRSMFVLNCVDGCIPSDLATGSSEEMEEERRLLYVAMTRAKNELALVAPQRFYVHGQPRNGDRSVYAARTRFIPPPLLKHFDRQTWPEAESVTLRAATDGPRVDLQARMRAMWR